MYITWFKERFYCTDPFTQPKPKILEKLSDCFDNTQVVSVIECLQKMSFMNCPDTWRDV